MLTVKRDSRKGSSGYLKAHVARCRKFLAQGFFRTEMMGKHSLVSTVQSSELLIPILFIFQKWSSSRAANNPCCSSEDVFEETAMEESWHYLNSSYDGLVDAKQLLGNHFNCRWSNHGPRNKESSLIDCHNRDFVWSIQDTVTQGGHSVPEEKQEVRKPLNV